MAATHATPPEQRFSVVVHSVAWDDRLDELVGLLSGRFGRSAALLAADLNRGRAEVRSQLTIHEVSAIIEELARLGVTAEAEMDKAPAPPVAGTMHVGWARAVAQVEEPPSAGTMMGMPVGAVDPVVETPEPLPEVSVGTPGPGDSEGAAQVWSRAAAIRAAMASGPRPDTMDPATGRPLMDAEAVDALPVHPADPPAERPERAGATLADAPAASPVAATSTEASAPPLETPLDPPSVRPVQPSPPVPAPRVHGEPALTAVAPAASPNTLISEDERVAAVRDLVPSGGAEPMNAQDRGSPETRPASEPSALPAGALAAAARAALQAGAASAADAPASPPARANAWGQVLGEAVRGPVARPSAHTSPLEGSASGMTVAAAHPVPGPEPLDSAFAALRSAAPGAPSESPARPAFERLRSPEPTPREVAEHGTIPARAWRAALLSALAPGAGQSYNGQPSRAVTFALAGLLVIPWGVSVFDAFKVARRQAERGIQIRPNPRRVAGAVGGFWVLVLALFTLFSVAGRALKPEVPELPPVASPAVVQPQPTVVPVSAEDIQAQQAREQAEQAEQAERFAGLVARARIACDQGQYDECRSLAEQALAIDESSPVAQRVHVEAVVGQSGTGPDAPPEPLIPDGNPPGAPPADDPMPPVEGTP